MDGEDAEHNPQDISNMLSIYTYLISQAYQLWFKSLNVFLEQKCCICKNSILNDNSHALAAEFKADRNHASSVQPSMFIGDVRMRKGCLFSNWEARGRL